jgi:hypothetical protein
MPIVALTENFKPTSLTGCQVWLDGADPAGTGIIPNDGILSTWADKSGNANHGTAVNGPTYSRNQNTVNFTYASSQYYTLPNGAFPFGDTSYSYFVVCKWNATTTSYGILGAGTSTADALWTLKNTSGAATIINTWNSDDITTSTSITPGATTCIGAFYTTGRGARSIWINFVSGASVSPTGFRAQPNINNTVGAGLVANSEFMNGTISEVVVYNSSLSTQNRQIVEAYLAQKWGLTLPPSHPGLTTRYYYRIPLQRNLASGAFTGGRDLIAPVPISNAMRRITQFGSSFSNLVPYSLVALASSLSIGSPTPAYLWSTAIPDNLKGADVILGVFFNMYNPDTQFAIDDAFDYGIYIDSTPIGLGDSTTARYVQTTASNYAISSGGITLGTNAILGYNPILLSITIPGGATNLRIGISNSTISLTTAAQIGVTVSIFSYTKNF